MRADTRHGRTVSVGWPLWEGGGMGADAATRDALRLRTGLEPMTTSAGVDAFHRALACGEPHVLVGPGDAAALRALLDAAPAPVPAAGGTPDGGPRPGTAGELLGFLKDALSRVTGGGNTGSVSPCRSSEGSLAARSSVK